MLSGISNSKYKCVKICGQRLLLLFTSAMKSAQLGQQFMQKPLIKTSVGLCKSCRGLVDLQLSYRFLGAL
jgi:hypothetical protein